MDSQGKTKTDLAKAVGVKLPYLSRVLGVGGANLTLKTIAKMEVAFDSPILMTPPQFENRVIHDRNYARALSSKVRQIRNEEASNYAQTSKEGQLNIVAPFQISIMALGGQTHPNLETYEYGKAQEQATISA